MLDFKGISVHYGHQDVLTNVTFRVNAGDRVGVVGPNGSGKSTLFKIVLGEMSTDSGELIIEGSPRIGFTRQNPAPDTPDETLLEYSLRGIPGLSEMEAEMAELESDLADPAKMKRYGELQTKFEHLGGYDIETRVKVALGGLGFTTEEFSKPFQSFSGGWRMRAELSRVLASKPDLLLLDEPSNYLDLGRHFGHRSEIYRLAALRTGVIRLCLRAGSSEEKSCRVLPCRTLFDLGMKPRQNAPVFLLTSEACVDGFPVGSRHDRNIQRRLHPAFHLKAVDPGFQKLRNMVDHTQIPGIEEVRSSLILLHGHVFPGPCLLHHRVFPAAGMGAGAEIRLSSGQERR